MASKARKLTGWKRDVHDPRDFKLTHAEEALKAYPEEYDMRPQMAPIDDQGSEGSCTSFASLAVIVFTLAELTGIGRNLSERFQYWVTRLLQGTTDEDSGASIRGAFKAFFKYGFCAARFAPYKAGEWSKEPSQEAFAEAAKHKLETGAYYSVQKSEAALKACLAANNPIACGFDVPKSFMSKAMAQSGEMQMPKAGEEWVGGHAVVLVGYGRDYFICRNSWGKKWGMSGYFKMPKAFVLGQHCSDFWTCIKAA
jgi:C1A family cysteine protease